MLQTLLGENFLNFSRNFARWTAYRHLFSISLKTLLILVKQMVRLMFAFRSDRWFFRGVRWNFDFEIDLIFIVLLNI